MLDGITLSSLPRSLFQKLRTSAQREAMNLRQSLAETTEPGCQSLASVVVAKKIWTVSLWSRDDSVLKLVVSLQSKQMAVFIN